MQLAQYSPESMRKSCTTNYVAIKYTVLATTENGSKKLRQGSTQKKNSSLINYMGKNVSEVSTDHKDPLNPTVNEASTKISPLEEERRPGQINF